MTKAALRPGEYEWVKPGRGVFKRGTTDGKFRYGISYTIPAAIARKYGVPSRRREMVGSSLTNARKKLAKRRTQIDEKDWSFLAPPPEAIPTLGEFVETYLTYGKANKPDSWVSDRHRLVHVVAFLGANTALDQVTRWNVERMKIARLEVVGPRTVNMELQVTRNLINKAIEWKKIPGPNPVDSKLWLRVKDNVIRTLTDEEEPRLFAAAIDHQADAYTISLHAGLRKSEIVRAECEHCLFDRGDTGELAVPGKGGRVRYIPMNAVLRPTLERLVRDAGGTGRLIRWAGKGITRLDNGWYKTLRRAGIVGLDFHDLRRTFGTRLKDAGVDLVTIRDLLGHRDIKTTMKYLGVGASSGSEAVSRLADRAKVAHPLAQAKKVPRETG